jgi:site-specific recombinase XerD
MPFELWPDADRKAWRAACEPGTRLKHGGPAGHLKPASREIHERHYGSFLGFLDRNELLRRDAPAGGNVTPENVEAYLAEAKIRLSPTTVHVAMCCLRRIARYMVHGLDLDWLNELAKDLALVAYPRSKSDRLILPERLIEAGLGLIQEAENSQSMTKLAQAIQVRNGLMVAMLGFHPIRRKNFAALKIGSSFPKIRGQWWIVLSATETKEKRADERRVNELLVPFIDCYIDRYRRLLVGSNSPSSALWLSSGNGARITEKHVSRLIAMTTLSTVGVRLTPHLFRTSAATAAAVYAGEHPFLGSAILHNADPRATQEHYNRATSLSAAETFRKVIRRYEKEPNAA